MARARPRARQLRCQGRRLARQTHLSDGAGRATREARRAKPSGRDGTPNSYRRTWGRAPPGRGGGGGGGGSRRASGRWKFESSRVATCPGGAKEPSVAAAMDDFAEEESCDFDLLPALSEDEVSLSGGGATALPGNRFRGWGVPPPRGDGRREPYRWRRFPSLGSGVACPVLSHQVYLKRILGTTSCKELPRGRGRINPPRSLFEQKPSQM